jgi:hypothetical protein
MKATTSRRRPGLRSWAALMPLLELLEAIGPRRGPCEVHYGTRSDALWVRHRPRYGLAWW